MTGMDLSDVLGPTIERDASSGPFFDAARRGELMIRRCALCARWLGPQAAVCTGCGGSELTWERATGRARLVTWCVVHSAPHGVFADQLPYVSGYVELTEGPWLPARIVGAGSGQLHPGSALTVAFVHPPDGESYPVFMPTPSSPARGHAEAER